MRVSVDPEVTADLTMSLNLTENRMIIRGDGDGKLVRGKLRLRAEAKLDATLTPEKADVGVSTRISGIPGGLSRIENLTARMTVPFEEARAWSGNPATFLVEAPVALFFVDKNMRAPLEKACQCKIPEVVKVTAEGKLWPEVLNSQPRDETPALAARIEVESINNKLISVDLAGEITVRKRGTEYLLEPEIDTRILIHSYQGLRRYLDAKGLLIPAPFDVLEGVIALSARGPMSFEGDRYVLPATVTVDLASARQKVKVASTITTTVDAKFTKAEVDVKAWIDALQIELPPLDPLRGKPRVLTDKRIISLPVPRRKPAPRFKLTASVQAETRSPGAIRLLWSYFKPYLPMTLKVERDGAKDTEGFIRAETFEIEYLRRVMKVERMRIDLSHAEDRAFPVDGRLRVRQTHYTVFIDISGAANHPNISLSSDPYLPESEIISVLLYDRTSDQLISADANTAGGVQAAVADRAIGLFGLWAFASTPIRSFSYDPATKVYKATVAITKDTTAAIGTDWEDATQLELRKRVSRRWVLTAAWTPATQDEEQKTTVTLQWERRY